MSRQAGGTSSVGADAALRDIVGRLVEALHPESVYLFGSRARGDAGPSSDYDLMVVMPEDAPAALLDPRAACKALVGAGVAVDVLVFRRSKFERQRHLKASMPATVEREGRILYAA